MAWQAVNKNSHNSLQAVNKNSHNSLSALTKHQKLTAWRSMTNINGIHKEIKATGQRLQTVTNFKYMGAIIWDAGSKPEMLSRIAQCTTTMTIWNDQNITRRYKVRLIRTPIISILLYAGETWTLTIELQRRIRAVEMRCYRRLLHISYKDHITNEIVCKKIQAAIGPYEDILTTVKKGSYDGSDM